MRRFSTGLAAVVVVAEVCWTADATADYRGPRAGADLNVARILAHPKDDQPVVLQGVILRQVAAERYVFSDGSGEIEIEIEDEEEVFPAEPVDDKTKIEISGEIDKDFRAAPEIDVDSMRILVE